MAIAIADTVIINSLKNSKTELFCCLCLTTKTLWLCKPSYHLGIATALTCLKRLA